MIVYVACRGSYSDRRVAGVFTGEDEAERVMKGETDDEDWDVQPYALDELAPPPPGFTLHRVALNENGDDLSTDRPDQHEPVTEPGWWHWQVNYTWRLPDGTMSPNRYYGSEASAGCTSTPEFWGTFHARDRDHALKIARDNKAASIAAGDLDRLQAKLAGYLVGEPVLGPGNRLVGRTVPRPNPGTEVHATHRSCSSHSDCREHHELALACRRPPPDQVSKLRLEVERLAEHYERTNHVHLDSDKVAATLRSLLR